MFFGVVMCSFSLSFPIKNRIDYKYTYLSHDCDIYLLFCCCCCCLKPQATLENWDFHFFQEAIIPHFIFFLGNLEYFQPYYFGCLLCAKSKFSMS